MWGFERMAKLRGRESRREREDEGEKEAEPPRQPRRNKSGAGRPLEPER